MRTVASSPRLASTDFSIRPLASSSNSSISSTSSAPPNYSAGALETSVPTFSPLTILSMLLSSPTLKT